MVLVRSGSGPSSSSSWKIDGLVVAVRLRAEPGAQRHDRVGEADRGDRLVRDPQHGRACVAGQRQRRGVVAGQHDVTARHPVGQRLGRIGEQFAAGAVAQRLGVEFVGQRGQVDAQARIDDVQDRKAGGQIAGQPELVGHPQPRRQHHRARPRSTSRSGPSSGATTTTLAPRRTPVAAAATSAGSPESSPATIRTSSAPIHGGTSDADDDRRRRRTAERPQPASRRPSRRCPGRPPRSRCAAGGLPQRLECALVQRGGGGAHLRARHRRRRAADRRGRRRADPRRRRGRSSAARRLTSIVSVCEAICGRHVVDDLVDVLGGPAPRR